MKDVAVREGAVRFTIELTTPACPVRDRLQEEARQAVAALPGVAGVEVTLTSRVRPSLGPAAPLVPGVKNVVPVASGKGGVGKSTVTANLALALARTGARVGIMDADVYGPSIPTLLGVGALPKPTTQRALPPAERYGVKVISMGFFLREDDAVIWRGPMLHKTVQHFLGEVDWGELDYLLVDLPPGTGDVQLTLCQAIPLTGAAIVSTPQEVALKVAQKAITMFGRLNTPVLGLIENMAYYVCPGCGAREEIFGSGGARAAAQRLGVPFLGDIPLATAIRTSGDAGRPVVLDEASPFARAYLAIAEKLAAQISIRNMQREVEPLVQIRF